MSVVIKSQSGPFFPAKNATPYMLPLLGDKVPQIPCRGFAPGPRWGTSVTQTPYTGLSQLAKSAYAPEKHSSTSPYRPLIRPFPRVAGRVQEYILYVFFRLKKHLTFYAFWNGVSTSV